jgi:D-alanine-D-alanine ligase
VTEASRAGSHVLVLAGGLSHERDVSLQSGRRVADALADVGVETVLRDADSGLLPELSRHRPAAVFPLLHGTAGEDGALQGILEMAGVPHVGASSASARLAFDKANAKELLERAGLRTPRSVVLRSDTIKMLGSAGVLGPIVAALGLPLVVKPTRGGSALGVSVVRERADLADALVHAYAYCDSVLLEQYLAGTEVAVAVIDEEGGPRALPAVEIAVEGGLYDYDARYMPGRAEFFAPARLSDAAAEEAARLAVRAHEVLGLRHLSRTDAIVDASGQAWFLEANVCPGMTSTSLVPQAARAAGIPLGQLCSSLVTLASTPA